MMWSEMTVVVGSRSLWLRRALTATAVAAVLPGLIGAVGGSASASAKPRVTSSDTEGHAAVAHVARASLVTDTRGYSGAAPWRFYPSYQQTSYYHSTPSHPTMYWGSGVEKPAYYHYHYSH